MGFSWPVNRFFPVAYRHMSMSTQKNCQRTHNEICASGNMIVSLAEALWRLRLAPTAADLVRVLPADALLADGRVDLARCHNDN